MKYIKTCIKELCYKEKCKMRNGNDNKFYDDEIIIKAEKGHICSYLDCKERHRNARKKESRPKMDIKDWKCQYLVGNGCSQAQTGCDFQPLPCPAKINHGASIRGIE